MPSTGVGAVVLDVAASSTTATGTTGVTVWASGTSRPSTPQLKVNTDSVPRSNTVIVQPGSDGKIAVYNGNGTTAINVDIQGYFTAVGGTSSLSPGGFVPTDLTRVLYTDDGTGAPAQPLAAGASLTVQVGGIGQIASDASSVFANVHAHNITADGRLQIVPAGSSASSAIPLMNYANGAQNDMGATLALSSAGKITIRNDGSQPVDIDIEVEGYFASGTSEGGGYTPMAPLTLGRVTLAPGASQDVAAGGVGGIPIYANGGVAVDFLATGATGSGYGYMHVSPSGQAMPEQAILGWHAGSDTTAASTSAIVRTGSSGEITVANDPSSPGNITITVVAEGWFGAAPVITGDDATTFETGALASGYSQDWVDQALYSESLLKATQVSATNDETETPEEAWDDTYDGIASDDGDVDDKGDAITLSDRRSSHCKEITGKITAKNIVGNTLWTFTQFSYWCYTGSRIVYRHSDYQQSSPGQMWSFVKLLANSSTPGNPWIRYRMGYFHQCAPLFGVNVCPHDNSPWIRQWMYANGTYHTDHW